jgi:hypothetical protein
MEAIRELLARAECLTIGRGGGRPATRRLARTGGRAELVVESRIAQLPSDRSVPTLAASERRRSRRSGGCGRQRLDGGDNPKERAAHDRASPDEVAPTQAPALGVPRLFVHGRDSSFCGSDPAASARVGSIRRIGEVFCAGRPQSEETALATASRIRPTSAGPIPAHSGSVRTRSAAKSVTGSCCAADPRNRYDRIR